MNVILMPALVEARHQLEVAGFVLQPGVLSCALAVIVCEDDEDEVTPCAEIA